VTIEQLFALALGRNSGPFDYQRRLATAESLPEALIVMTGGGKTAAVVLGWLYRRRFASDSIRANTPRRLVICLPMRTLVNQVHGLVREWLTRLDLLDDETRLERDSGVSVHVLMGGADDSDWHLQPHRDAIIIGTQDVLLSAALNRGYGISRFSWPWRFALLSNDCLWVFDEVQLMGVGLATGLQLSAFRQKLSTFGASHSMFVSATLQPSWLSTVDHPAPVASNVMTLGDGDLKQLASRRNAIKRVARARTAIAKGCEKVLASEILERHISGTRTIVVLNRVDRAIQVFTALKRAARALDIVLIHSRFRPKDRAAAIAKALDPSFSGIVVTTQVIEAGVDVSSRTLFTELAPWSSFVQRAGRCNREGECTKGADIYWIDQEEMDKNALPYDQGELVKARTALELIDSASPASLEAVRDALTAPVFEHVVRRRDLLDLFDTTPDLSGTDIDVSRFIREGDERDVRVFWRSDPTREDQPRPVRDELCTVPVYEMKRFLERDDKPRCWRWDPLAGEWIQLRSHELFPGLSLILDADAGGYDAEIGWISSSKLLVPSLEPVAEDRLDPEDAMDGDPRSELKQWVTLNQHALDAHEHAKLILEHLPDIGELRRTVALAAQVHDLGKAHDVFQTSMQRLGPAEDGVWAKSGSKGRLRHAPPGFRHELASALGWLQSGTDSDGERDLVAYLLMAHHGKIRLSIRATSQDLLLARPSNRGHDDLFARGVFHGDTLPDVELGGLTFPSTTLSLMPMRVGRTNGEPSWAERALALRDRFGPFRLAYLEALVRTADVRASIEEDRP
jgi:CRISPR-associated endonuclease/helicase Cas3